MVRLLSYRARKLAGMSTAQTQWTNDFLRTLERLEPRLADRLTTKAAAREQYQERFAEDPEAAARQYHRRQLHALEFPPADTDYNGHLANVPAEAHRTKDLPDPDTSEVDRVAHEVDAGGFGSFRIFYQRSRTKHSGWRWVAYWADRLDQPSR